MNKYQFYISYNDKLNTASSKAIDDCTQLLIQQGYKDYNLNFDGSRGFYIGRIVLQLMKLVVQIEAGAIVAIQYPLLSGNRVFKYILAILRVKKVKFFCIVHDLDELRYGDPKGKNGGTEIQLLNCYDAIVVHNDVMKNWLFLNGVTVHMVSLNIFDYLSAVNLRQMERLTVSELQTVVFAGNLSKSNFLYKLGNIPGWHFNAYGSNYQADKAIGLNNVTWMGSFSPDEILERMNGAFGLIWDGELTDGLDDKFGNYLKYNNPHKLSLYLAAGLPVIAPKESAIASIIRTHNIGLLISSLSDLKELNISAAQHLTYQQNVREFTEKVKDGYYLTSSILAIEGVLLSVKRYK
jgi:hypothetical protein